MFAAKLNTAQIFSDFVKLVVDPNKSLYTDLITLPNRKRKYPYLPLLSDLQV